MALLSFLATRQAILLVATVAISLLLSWLGYLAFLHPLSKYPGPFLAKFSNLYSAYHGWTGDIHLDVCRCHEKYGKFVRYGPNKLLFHTAEALRDIYDTGNSKKFIKATQYLPLIHRAPNTLTIRDNGKHAQRRRLMAQGVSDKAQRGFEHRLLHQVEAFCGQLFPREKMSSGQRVWSLSMDMSDWCYYLSFDIMADVVFGARYNLLGSSQFRYVTKAIDQSNVRMSLLVQIPDLAAWKLDKYFLRGAIRARNLFVKFVARVVKERSSKDAYQNATRGQDNSEFLDHTKTDIFAHLAAARDPVTGSGFRPEEVHAESTTLIIAGSDTSSTALSALFFYLANNPTAYTAACTEIRTRFSSHEAITIGSTLSSCTYLRACIDESLRMSPSVGTALLREVLHGGALIDSESIPAGCDVGVSIYSIHHNESYYEYPYQYRPERWLIDDGTGSVDRARSVFNPFSLGTRSCLGKSLAYTELMLTMATVLFVGDFKFASENAGQIGRGWEGSPKGRHRKDEYQLWDHVTAQKKGPILTFALR